MAGWAGIARSLLIYRRPGRQRRLRAFYRPFVRPGDLVFDVGAHVGDRTTAFAALGARVVAVEPQPSLLPWLRRLTRGNRRVTVCAAALGREPGTARMRISRRTPTVSSLSARWCEAVAAHNRGFRRVRWDDEATVAVTTLDALIDLHGTPAFCKVDVEGYEAEVLAGLSRPLRALSVEFVAGWLQAAVACVEHLETLGAYEYNVAAGERRGFLFAAWQAPARVAAFLAGGAGGVASGDLYARRLEAGDA